MERESDPNCRQLQKDYIQFVRQLSSREAVSRRFFLIFEYEPFNVNRKVEEKEILAALETAAQTAKPFYINAATMCWFMTMKMSLQPMYSTLY